ncbi:hypothetical protein QVD17_38674 [Tagetes erecta]|uniref:Diacylglycerol kinase n=1 Tax=Tagetes erecta TaxID=13708 RepID=A0AAD8JNL5_TARER|nr:hypothetical protein QVD17_38674 [Tagetes erecta]
MKETHDLVRPCFVHTMSFPPTHSAASSSSSSPCLQFTFSDIQLATNNFDESLVIGRGGFGKVYKGTITYEKNLLDAAIKRLEAGSNQGAKEFLAEIEMLSKKQAVDRSNDEDHCGLAAWAHDSIKEGRLKKIVDSDIRASISPKCLEKFALLADRCLHSRPKERPTMADVVVALDSILALQEKTDMPSNSYNHDDFWIPDYVLLHGSEVKKSSRVPACPVIVFVNSKSGGQLGGELLISYRTLLNKYQVFDLDEHAPDKVLQRLYFNIEKLKHEGDSLAPYIESKLRIIVAGGDGTAGWILGVISDLNLAQPPPVATVPLGTINNLPFAFGWGKKNPGTDLESVMMFLNQVKYAKEMKVDSWHVLMRMKFPHQGSCDPIPPLDLPQSLHAIHPAEDELEEYRTFRGGFWNYFSMGMDAQVSYGFHTERKLHPEKFKNQAANLSAYAKVTSSQGWFWPSLFHPSSCNIAQLAKVSIMRRPGYWEFLSIPHTIRSIVCLNLPSFSGGLNPWGIPSKKKHNREWTAPYVDDGFLEVVGFQNAWNGTGLYASSGQGTRLAQARRIRFEFHKGATDRTFMSMDGEPWKQPLPIEDDTVLVEISCSGQVSILATGTFPSVSVNDPSTPRTFMDDEIDSDEDDDVEYISEERRKFGAASSFRLPEYSDLSHLS